MTARNRQRLEHRGGAGEVPAVPAVAERRGTYSPTRVLRVDDLAVPDEDADVVDAMPEEEHQVPGPHGALAHVAQLGELGVRRARQRLVRPVLVHVHREPRAVEGPRANGAVAVTVPDLRLDDPNHAGPSGV